MDTMYIFIGELAVSLLLILVAAETFTNALEHLGERLGISEGVTGSLFAAVGTAMPETMVPLLAIFMGTANSHINEEIGVGAILGAPLMLSTLSLFLMGVSIIKKRGLYDRIKPEKEGLSRDLDFFLFAFILAACALFIPADLRIIKVAISITLVLSYFIYIMLTIKASAKLVEKGHGTEADAPLFLARIGLPDNMFVIVIQIIIGLSLIIAGAKGFITGVGGVSHCCGISALLLSLLIIPIATELPEKVNSILWIRRHKDTLAVGNITGAMVFQGSLLPAIGITLTPWVPRIEVTIGILITLIAATWLRLRLRHGGIKVWTLLVNGVLYITYIVVVTR